MPDQTQIIEPARAAPGVNADAPWLGLLPFTEETQRFFFGRDAEIREIFLRVRDQPLTVLHGQSGLGKSSLLGAGARDVEGATGLASRRHQAVQDKTETPVNQHNSKEQKR